MNDLVKLSRNRNLTVNKILVILLIATAALGPYLFPIHIEGINLFGFRLLSLLALALLPILTRNLDWRRNPITKIYIALGVTWLAWGSLGLLWTPDFPAGIKELLSIGLGFAIGIIFLCLQSYTDDGLMSIGWGWMVAFLLTASVAIWELTTSHHLSGSYLAHNSTLRRIASTFGNTNDYGAFLVLSYPFLWLVYQRTKSPQLRWGQWLLIASVPVLVIFTASRLSAIAFFMQLLVLTASFLRNKHKHSQSLILVTLSAIILITGMLNPTTDIHRKMSAAVHISSPQNKKKHSFQSRIFLTLNGLWLTEQTSGRGVGPGGFEYFQLNKLVPYHTRVSNPHNFWIEILSQYGILVFCLFVSWYLSLYVIAFKKRQTSTSGILLAGLVGYIFAAVANSSYMAQQTNWVFLASIMILAVYLTSRQLKTTPQDVKS